MKKDLLLAQPTRLASFGPVFVSRSSIIFPVETRYDVSQAPFVRPSPLLLLPLPFPLLVPALP